MRVSKKTILKTMRRARGPHPRGQSWSTFLRNPLHQTWACDFLQTNDIWFRPIFAFFIIEFGSRRVVHIGVTRNPTATWTAQQLREARPSYRRCSRSTASAASTRGVRTKGSGS